MSAWVTCPTCGGLMEVPAYEGDGVYHGHICDVQNTPVSQYQPATEQPEEEA